MVAGFWIIAGSAIGLAFLVQLINKLTINEKYVDETKEKMNKMQKEIKGMDVKSKEFQANQEKIIDMNLGLMKQQMKPMIFTFIPYIVGFWILGAMFGFIPVAVGSDVTFEVNGHGMIVSECLELNKTIDGKETFEATVGSDNCTILVNNQELDVELIGLETEHTEKVGDTSVVVSPQKQIFITLPFNIPFVGNEIGWLGTFIIFSFTTSMILTKALKGKYLRKWE